MCTLKIIGFSNRSVSKWNESEPGIWKVQKVADYLGVTIEALLKSGGEKFEISQADYEDIRTD